MVKKKFGELTQEDYDYARWVMGAYENQVNPKIQVSVRYNATIFATVKVSAKLSIDEIKEELKYGYHEFDLDDEPDIIYNEITELIVGGHEIKL